MNRKDSDWISISTAVRELPISRPRLIQAIEQGQIEAVYSGTKSVRVRRNDVWTLLTTPPRKPQAHPAQAA
ncbi:hypothetical protein [Methylomagnum ishizawai]|uniref:hypothetical protein n=1 Tax=Methylomagnum ishizawai TaxID=1760988 RepID=UPI001C337FF3|nr:hypothetical protein [Methylomagnum ishizawai]BBL77463.1 hypothetical protein MishRS11D_45610 [Methylomagnum ishizawai]